MLKKNKKTALLNLEEHDERLKIEAGIELKKITLDGQIWTGVLKVKTILSESFFRYKLILELDEHPYLTRIDELTKSLDATLFKNEKSMRKATNEKVGEVRSKLEELRKECEVIKFSAQVDSLKYEQGGTTITMRLPDDIVEPFNRQKTRLQLYKISLVPII